MDGVREKAEAEHEREKGLAWHIAALPLSKKFPSYDKFVGRKPRQQSPEEMMQIARMWQIAVEKRNAR